MQSQEGTWEMLRKFGKGQFELTNQLIFYWVKLIFRVTVVVSMYALYFTRRDLITKYMEQPFYKGITLVHVIWLVFMLVMLLHLLSQTHLVDRLTMAIRKSRAKEFVPVKNYDRRDLLEYVQDMNIKAWIVMLVWLGLNAVIGLLYVLNIFHNEELLMCTVTFYLCDYICILFFCPFQTFIMHDKCCVNCRIYDWGHFMMFTPMLFIKNFYSWSLFFMSCIVLLHWELIYARHPERFWEGSNKTLQCTSCKDKTCQMKNLLRGKGLRAGVDVQK